MTAQPTLPLELPELSTVSRSLGTNPADTGTGRQEGIFDWFRYVQDFHGEFAMAWLRRLGNPGDVVWEPFSGSGTTLVAAKLLGHTSFGYDVSPLMVDVARAKTDWTLQPESIRAEAARVAERVTSPEEPTDDLIGEWPEFDRMLETESQQIDFVDKKLARWISPAVRARFVELLRTIDYVEDPSIRRFLRVAAASLLIPCSNMTFRPNICYERRPRLDAPVVSLFTACVADKLSDYEAVRSSDHAVATVDIGDARSDGPENADLIFTSPPYPNDMEYVHQTRLELALLEYVSDKRDLTKLKKQMISSSVKLVYRENEWQKVDGLEVPGVAAVVAPIAETLVGRNWGWNAADMVAQYFGGMRSTMRNWNTRLRPGGVAAVVIGDSAFNGVLVRSDVLLAEVAEVEGFTAEGIEVIRTRWNTKHDIELRESVVLLRAGD